MDAATRARQEAARHHQAAVDKVTRVGEELKNAVMEEYLAFERLKTARQFYLAQGGTVESPPCVLLPGDLDEVAPLDDEFGHPERDNPPRSWTDDVDASVPTYRCKCGLMVGDVGNGVLVDDFSTMHVHRCEYNLGIQRVVADRPTATEHREKLTQFEKPWLDPVPGEPS